MTEKIINISIRIADLPWLPLNIPLSQEEIVRRAEANINDLWRKWSRKTEFKDKSSAEILAMVTFRFAQEYYSVLESYGRVDRLLENLESGLTELLFGTEEAENGAGSEEPATREV